jgi:light-regulated signal transduction histidine kinase (bacteriophytochrome)
MRIVGGIGYTNVFPIEKMVRDARLAQIWTGTNEIMSLLIQHEYYKELLNDPNPPRMSEEDAEEAHLEDEKAIVRITDTGRGIPDEQIGRIFDPGFTTKGVGVGSGLSLAICYQIMQKHRGQIDVESRVGKGSTITISLPSQQSPT